VGSTVIQVQAVDDDIGPNGAVRYRLKQDLVGNWRTFSIDEMTGVIQLKKELDREQQKIYEVMNAMFYCRSHYSMGVW
jgi:hypothetical protein